MTHVDREYLDILNRMTAWELRLFLRPDPAGIRPTLPAGFERRAARLAAVEELTASEAAGVAERKRFQITGAEPAPTRRRWRARVICLERPGESFTAAEAAAIAKLSSTGLYNRLERGGATVKGLTFVWEDEARGRVAC